MMKHFNTAVHKKGTKGRSFEIDKHGVCGYLKYNNHDNKYL